jgi:hypothetical protein
MIAKRMLMDMLHIFEWSDAQKWITYCQFQLMTEKSRAYNNKRASKY